MTTTRAATKAETSPTSQQFSKKLRPLIPLAIALLIILAPQLGVLDAYWARTVMLICGLALLVSSTNIVLGYAGELTLGQVALYATGAYVAGYLGREYGITEVLIVVPVAVGVGLIAGLITGIPGVRISGMSLAMVTFFMVLLIPSMISVFDNITGGSSGMSVKKPTFFGITLDPTRGHSFYIFTVLTTVVWFAIARNIVGSRHGAAFLTMKHSQVLAASLGISVFQQKLKAYLLSAIPATLAGVLFAMLQGYIAPDSFTFALAINILAASVIGGSTSIYAAFLGAALLQISQQEMASFAKWEMIVSGAFLVAAGVLLKNGVVGLLQDLWRKVVLRRGGSTTVVPVELSPEMRAEIESMRIDGDTLQVDGISKRFGGNTAVDNVSMRAQPGQITSLIGPNGSGKTTLLNLVCGFYPPSSGSVTLGDVRLDGLASYKIARVGVTRTFQTPNIPAGLTTRQFVATGRYTAHASNVLLSTLRLPAYYKATKDDDVEADRLLALVGLAHIADLPVDSLPLGTRRLVEVARCIAARPKLFCFDEVGSGLDEADLQRLEEAILMIKRMGGTVILVEHNFPLVLKLSDSIYVLAQGALLASGTPQEIQENPRVLAEYIGATSDDVPSNIEELERGQAEDLADGPRENQVNS